MPHREQAKQDLEATLQRIRDGEGYISRMEQLVARTAEHGLDPSAAEQHLGEMRAALAAFYETRDRLQRIIGGDAESPPSDVN